MKAKPGDRVCVEWTDANGQRDQLSLKDALALPLPVVHTYGRLLERNSKRVTVAGEVLNEDGEESFRATTVIPRGMVKVIRRLRQNA